MTEHDPWPPQSVLVPTMRQRWESLTFLHWPYPVEVVAAHLPRGLELEPFDGTAWVGLVPFRMHVQTPIGPKVRLVPPFPETNVRTYVRGPGGRPGIWFFSLDAGSRSAVATARATYKLPYFQADMSIDETADAIRYRSSRREPGPEGVGHDIEIEPGAEMSLGARSELDNYLTARYTLWNSNRGVLLRTQADHEPWPLRTALVRRLEQNLLEAAGLPAPTDPPIVHYSPGVDVRISAPRPGRRARPALRGRPRTGRASS
jgi:uncharacterized protein YqjF (DUF2071 family)